MKRKPHFFLDTPAVRHALASLAVACLTLVAALVSDRAHAASSAYLVSCNPGQSATGAYGFVGLYQLPNGNQVEYWFAGSCPFSITVN